MTEVAEPTSNRGLELENTGPTSLYTCSLQTPYHMCTCWESYVHFKRLLENVNYKIEITWLNSERLLDICSLFFRFLLDEKRKAASSECDSLHISHKIKQHVLLNDIFVGLWACAIWFALSDEISYLPAATLNRFATVFVNKMHNKHKQNIKTPLNRYQMWNALGFFGPTC